MSAEDEDPTREASVPGPSSLVDRFDAVLALVLILACGLLYYETTGFDRPAMFLGDNVLPEEFPRMLLWLIGALALALPFEHLLERKRHPLIREARSAAIGFTTWATIALLMVILAFAPTIGTILTILVSSLVVPVLWGERRWWLLIVYSIGFTAVVTYIFAVVLRVYFEPGLFGITIR